MTLPEMGGGVVTDQMSRGPEPQDNFAPLLEVAKEKSPLWDPECFIREKKVAKNCGGELCPGATAR